MLQQLSTLPSLSRPDLFARSSLRVQKADRYFRECIAQIGDPQLAALVQRVLTPLCQPDATWQVVQNAVAQKNEPELCQHLEKRADYDIWWGAPAAAATSHHPYPGGWLMHNATNLHTLNMMLSTAHEMRGLQINPDALLAGMLLHDCLKPQLLLWEDGVLHPGKGGAHHVAGLAESYLHGVPADVLLMQAGVHAGWWRKPESVQGFFEAAGALIDAPELAEIGRKTHLIPETWIMNLGEQSWYGATREAYQQIKTPLEELLETFCPPDKRVAAQWHILMQRDELELLRDLAEGTFEKTIKVLLETP